MSLPQREHPDAVVELDSAVAWYEDHEAGLGSTLIDRAEAARAEIAEWPNAAPPFPQWDRDQVVRSVRIRGYPYRVVYLVRDNELVVLAYAHERRRPGYWAERVTTS